jgi:hypothetical protein
MRLFDHPVKKVVLIVGALLFFSDKRIERGIIAGADAFTRLVDRRFPIRGEIDETTN